VIPGPGNRTHNSLRLASSTISVPGGTMLEWKFRLVTLLAFAAILAVALGSFTSALTNYNW